MEIDVFIMHPGLIDRNFHRQPQHILCIAFNEAAVFILSYILLPEQQWFGFGFRCFSILAKLNGEREKETIKNNKPAVWNSAKSTESFSSPTSHRFTAYPNCAPTETKKEQKGSCCTNLEAESFSSSISKLWHMFALAMKLLDREK